MAAFPNNGQYSFGQGLGNDYNDHNSYRDQYNDPTGAQFAPNGAFQPIDQSALTDGSAFNGSHLSMNGQIPNPQYGQFFQSSPSSQVSTPSTALYGAQHQWASPSVPATQQQRAIYRPIGASSQPGTPQHTVQQRGGSGTGLVSVTQASVPSNNQHVFASAAPQNLSGGGQARPQVSSAQYGDTSWTNQPSTQQANPQYGGVYSQNSFQPYGAVGQTQGQTSLQRHVSQHQTLQQGSSQQVSQQPAQQRMVQPPSGQQKPVQQIVKVPQQQTAQQQAPTSRPVAAPLPSSKSLTRDNGSRTQDAAAIKWGVPNMSPPGQRLTSVSNNLRAPAALFISGTNLHQHLGRTVPIPVERISQHIDSIVPGDDAGNAKREKELRVALKKEGKDIPSAYIPKLRRKPERQGESSAVITAGVDDANDDSDDTEDEDRPDDPIDAAVWDARQITYSEDQREAYTKLADFIIEILDALKTAEPNDKTHEEKLIRVLDGLGSKTQYAWIVEQMGQHLKLLSRLFTLLDRSMKSKTLGGDLATAVFRWMSVFKSFDAKVLSHEKLKPKFRLEKYLSKADDKEVESLVKKILENIQASEKAGASGAAKGLTGQQPTTATTTTATMQNQLSSKKNNNNPISTTTTTNLPASSSKDTARAPSSSPSKRPLEDSSEDRLSKKVALNSTSSSTSTKPAKQPSTSATTSSASASVTSSKPALSAGGLPGKGRTVSKPLAKVETTNSVAGKATMPKGNTSKAGTSKEDPLKPVASKVKKPAPAKATFTSSIGSLLAGIEKPKEPSKPADTAKSTKTTPETPEEKAKRLRKESRRSLRVSWKEGDELTQIKYFETVAHEHTGIQDKTMRGEEGKALKDAKAKANSMGALEEDDDGNEKPWHAPTQINMSNIPDDLKARTYETRGGLIAVNTPDQAAMKKREDTVLMEIYTDPADIPATPKSPLLGAVDPVQNAPAEGISLPAQDQRFREIHQRWHESGLHGIPWATQAAVHRAHTKMAAEHAASQQSSIPPYSGGRGDEVLRLLKLGAAMPHKAVPDPKDLKTKRRYDYPDPEFQKIADNVEEVCAQFFGLPAIADRPPAHIKDPMRIEEWWKGYNRDKERKAAQKAQEEQAKQQAAQQQAAQAAATQNQTAASTAQNPSSSWDQWFAAHHAYNQGKDIPQEYRPAYQHWLQQQAQQTQPAPVQQPNNDVQNLLAALGGSGATVQTQPQQTDGIQNLLAALAGSGNAQAPQHGASAPVPAINPADPAALLQFLSSQQGVNNQLAASPNNTGGFAQQASSHESYQGSQDSHGQVHQRGGYGGHGYDGAGSGQGQGQREHQQHQYGNRNKREHRDRESRNSRDGRDNHNRDSRDDSGVPSHLRGINRNLIGTKPCIFYSQGKCTKGDKCTFRHD